MFKLKSEYVGNTKCERKFANIYTVEGIHLSNIMHTWFIPHAQKREDLTNTRWKIINQHASSRNDISVSVLRMRQHLYFQVSCSIVELAPEHTRCVFLYIYNVHSSRDYVCVFFNLLLCFFYTSDKLNVSFGTIYCVGTICKRSTDWPHHVISLCIF